MDNWMVAAIVLATAGVCLFVGAGIGHYTRAVADEREANRRKRLHWQAGYEVGHAEGRRGVPMRSLHEGPYR